MTNQNINATRIEDQSDPATEMRLTDVELGSFVGGNVPFYDQPSVFPGLGARPIPERGCRPCPMQEDQGIGSMTTCVRT